MESSSQSGLWVQDEGAYPQRWESWDNLRVGHRCSVMDRTGYFTRFTLPYLTLPHVKFSDKASDVSGKLGVFTSLTGMTRRSRMRRRNDSSLRLQASSFKLRQAPHSVLLASDNSVDIPLTVNAHAFKYSGKRPCLVRREYNFNWIAHHLGFLSIDRRAWSQ